MFPVIGAAASIFMVAQQNMLLLDLFHNWERRELSNSTVFQELTFA